MMSAFMSIPYIVPLNFGLDVQGTQVYLYFHSAMEGTKLDLIARDNRAAFEMDCDHNFILYEERISCTMGYASVIGHCGQPVRQTAGSILPRQPVRKWGGHLRHYEVQELSKLIRTRDRLEYERRKALTLDVVEILEAVRI